MTDNNNTTQPISKLCRYRVYTSSGTRGCKLRTKNTNGFCHIHSNSITTTFLEDMPENCPVCMEKFNSTARALRCGHYCHLKCILKSETNRCPICRVELPEIIYSTRKNVYEVYDMIDDPIFEISTGMIASIVISYQIYSAAMSQRDIPLQTLDEFISDSIDTNTVQIIADISIEERNAIIDLLSTLAQDAINNPDQWF